MSGKYIVMNGLRAAIPEGSSGLGSWQVEFNAYFLIFGVIICW